MTIEPLNQYDILMKDFKDKKIKQVSTTALGTKAVSILEFVDFKIDQNKSSEMFDYLFIEIEQEDTTKVWSRESFSFDDILGMEFL